MTARAKRIGKVLDEYDLDDLAIGTLGSHSALNIFKGAKEEGFRTVCLCKERDMILYERFPLVDEIILVDDFAEMLDDRVQEKLRRLNTILVPHGSFTAYLSAERLTDELRVPMFGNSELLSWETSREKQRKWLLKAGLRLPRTFESPEEISGLVIAKLPGARGGKGYFLANSTKSFYKKTREMVSRGLISKEDVNRIHLQEYVLGVSVYPHYFRSVVKGEAEFFGVDRRYETAVDAIGRIPAGEQLELGVSPSYTVVGNFPLVLRESLLPELIRMGDNVVKASEEIAPPGIVGPFCLETAITESMEIYAFEISARIVAGTNVGIGTSPYAYLKYGENMYMGRRIALEIKEALEKGLIRKVLT